MDLRLLTDYLSILDRCVVVYKSHRSGKWEEQWRLEGFGAPSDVPDPVLRAAQSGVKDEGAPVGEIPVRSLRVGGGLVDGWTWTLVGDGRYCVFERLNGTAQPPAPNTPQASSPPSPEPATPCYSDLQGYIVPHVPLDSQTEFLRLFYEGVDWSATALGPMRTWSAQLRAYCDICLLSPFPVLLAWGPEMTLLYNWPYSRNIASKHPAILGLGYDKAWPEVWDQIEPFVRAAYRGEGTHVDNTPMFLKRVGRDVYEEVFYTWSMIPIRDDNRKVSGIFIPNFESTPSMLANRRIAALSDLVRRTAPCDTASLYWDCASLSLSQSPAREDCGTFIIYSTNSTASANLLGLASSGSSWTADEVSRFEAIRDGSGGLSKRAAETLHRVFCGPRTEDLPNALPVLSSPEPGPTGLEKELLTVDGVLKQGLRKLANTSQHVLFGPQETQTLFGNRPSRWGDPYTASVMFAVRPGQTQTIEAIVLIALNPRRPFDAEYQRFITVLASQIGTGLSRIKLFEDQLEQARYRAWYTEQQREEVAKALERRTKELLQVEGRFTKVAGLLPCGLWMADRNGEIIYANEAWYRISGHPKDKPPSDFMESIVDEDKAASKTQFMSALAQQLTQEEQLGGFMFRWNGLTNAGLPRWCTAHATYELDEKGQFAGLIGTISDQSERKHVEVIQSRRAEDAIRQRVKMNRFVDILSHEVRNPMAAIMSCVELIVDRLKEASPQLRSMAKECFGELETINFCLRHMNRLVDETLTLSKIEHDSKTIAKEAFQPEALVRETMRMYEAQVQSEKIQTALHVGSGLRALGPRRLHSDPARIMQILINFLTNAIKFTAKRPIREITVTVDALDEAPDLPHRNTSSNETELSSLGKVSAARQAAAPERCVYLYIAVKDTGLGLDPEQQAVLFQRFIQAPEPKTQTVYGGSGLGLYISRKLAQTLGGACGMESTAGQGSTFSFYVKATITKPSSSDTSRATSPLPPERPPTTRTAEPSSLSSLNLDPRQLLPMKSGGSVKLSRSFHVVLMEDNQINQKLLTKQLVRKGCVVHTADDGAAGVELLLSLRASNAPVDICLMDVEMPILDGLQATRQIRQLEHSGNLGLRTEPGFTSKKSRGLPILGVTANARPEQIAQMLEAGMQGVMTKPFKIIDVMARIASIVDEY